MSVNHRYLFTVRLTYGEVPTVDSYYEVQCPPGISGDEAKVMNTLSDGNFFKKEVQSDSQTFRGMSMRLRFNNDMYQHVCLINSDDKLTAELLEDVIASNHHRGTLMKFLKDTELG